MSNSFDDNDNGPSFDEYGIPFSESQLSQIESDASTKSKIKICPICNIDFIDNSYWGECTCGDRFCEEEYQKIHGNHKNYTRARSNRKKTRFFEDDRAFFLKLNKKKNKP
jgi:hypothetical protein